MWGPSLLAVFIKIAVNTELFRVLSCQARDITRKYIFNLLIYVIVDQQIASSGSQLARR
jgi:hypothetical protein